MFSFFCNIICSFRVLELIVRCRCIWACPQRKALTQLNPSGEVYSDERSCKNVLDHTHCESPTVNKSNTRNMWYELVLHITASISASPLFIKSEEYGRWSFALAWVKSNQGGSAMEKWQMVEKTRTTSFSRKPGVIGCWTLFLQKEVIGGSQVIYIY